MVGAPGSAELLLGGKAGGPEGLKALGNVAGKEPVGGA